MGEVFEGRLSPSGADGREGDWRLPPIEKPNQGCACCPVPAIHRELDSYLHPGFGGVEVTRDDEYAGHDCGEHTQLSHIEALAKDDPEHDWRVEIIGPLHGETYQRQGEGLWVMVESNQGFA